MTAEPGPGGSAGVEVCKTIRDVCLPSEQKYLPSGLAVRQPAEHSSSLEFAH